MTSHDLGTAGRMCCASAPNTTRTLLENEQFPTAISKAVFLPNGASAFGKGRACELPAARMIGMISSRLCIRRRVQNKRTGRQTPALESRGLRDGRMPAPHGGRAFRLASVG